MGEILSGELKKGCWCLEEEEEADFICHLKRGKCSPRRGSWPWSTTNTVLLWMSITLYYYASLQVFYGNDKHDILSRSSHLAADGGFAALYCVTVGHACTVPTVKMTQVWVERGGGQQG